ncbi:DNA-directed RNA polymerases II 24 kDa polypeptide (RNA polymerase II subunit 5) [Nowakowskiella sp. JEL0407]|nr:DNA-directed RNA polymerases II 24 kDa polypeptide (RNA polymerase II subunit 5) [Nowakowskiella sp. JEL0407]
MEEERTERETIRLWRIYRTLHQMVNDRGYQVTANEREMSLDHFKSIYVRGGSVERKELEFVVQAESNPNDQLLVMFQSGDVLRIKELKAIYLRMESQALEKAIIVCQKAPTTQSSKIITEMQSRFHLEVFQEAELLVNITKHSLVPEHQVLTADEKAALLLK